METEYERSHVERLKRKLYTPGNKAAEYRPPEFTPNQVDVEEEWRETIEQTPAPFKTERPQPLGVFVLKIMIALAGFAAVGALGFVGYTVWDPLSKPSDKNILISAEIPVAVASGVATPIRVSVTNNNRVPLEYATLSVIYPPGTKSGTSLANDIHEDKKLIGGIDPGAVAMYDQQAVFLGEENTDQELHFRLEYRFRGINSIFTKDEVRPLRLNSSPVNLSVNTLNEINAGQTLDLELVVTSNTVIPLKDIIAHVEYPQGFNFVDADPKPEFGSNGWKIGAINPGDKLKIHIRGVMSGEDGQEKVFHTSVGVTSGRQDGDIAAAYSSALTTIVLKTSFIGIDLLFDNKPVGDSITNFGKQIMGTINWRNNLNLRIVNAEIEVKLKGSALDRRSISAGNGGFYRSSDDTIFWDERGAPELALIDSGGSGSVSFGFLPLPAVSTTGSAMKNPMITAEITVRGKRISETGVPEEVKTVSIRSVRVTSDVQFASKVISSIGPIANRGPIPPQVDQETTYTVVWSIVNTSNDIANATVRAVIPPYVQFTGAVSPAKENLIYNDTTKEIIWTPGTIPAGTGVSLPAREGYFQIMLKPSLSQVNQAPILLREQKFSAQDAYTGQSIEQSRGALTTHLSNDPKYSEQDALVVP